MRPRRPWSDRLPADLTPNPVSLAVKARREARQPIIDLTESNPTRAGFSYPADLLAPLADPAGLVYDPRPLGRASFGRYARPEPDPLDTKGSAAHAYARLMDFGADADGHGPEARRIEGGRRHERAVAAVAQRKGRKLSPANGHDGPDAPRRRPHEHP